MDQDLLLQGTIIDSPCAHSGTGMVWNIIGVGWGRAGSKHLSLLSPLQPPTPSSLAGAATATASALRGRHWGGAVTPYGLGA